MKNYLNITSKLPFDKLQPKIISVLLSSRPEYIYFDSYPEREGGKRYVFSAKTKKNIPKTEVSKAISEWIIRYFSKQFAGNILKEDFVEVSDADFSEITDKALNLMGNYEKKLAKKILCQKLIRHFEDNDHISIDGFLRFRATELRRNISELLFEEVDNLLAKKEYLEFISLIKEYILYSKTMISLLHIKVNDDQSFSLYNFQKKELDILGYSSAVRENDQLLSIVLSLNPKRIIWHDKGHFDKINLLNTIKEIFGNNFSECTGCELCKSTNND